jgi:hypothetical protein
MKLVELIGLFTTFQTSCVMKDENRDLMDDITDVTLSTSGEDGYYYLTVTTKKNMYKHKVPKVDPSLLHELKNAVYNELDRRFKNKD